MIRGFLLNRMNIPVAATGPIHPVWSQVAMAIGGPTISVTHNDAGGPVRATPVRGITCLSCAATIRQHLKAMPGISQVEVKFAERLMRVTYAANQPTLPVRIVSSINSLGYHVGKAKVVR